MEITSKNIRLLTLDLIYQSGSSHLGSCFSIADILACLYDRFLTETDTFLLSKGHAAACLYSTLALKNIINREELIEKYGKNDSYYMTHASHKVEGVHFSSGSLGMMASVGVGIAMANAQIFDESKTVIMLSDGELNEGSNWEAFMYASHKKLKNLTFILDKNNLQSLTTTKDTIDMGDLRNKFTAFGLDTYEVSGHDISEIDYALNVKTQSPKMIIANTIKGKGSALIENQILWHYKSPNQIEYDIIKADLNA